MAEPDPSMPARQFFIPCFCYCFAVTALCVRGGPVDDDWKALVALDSGPEHPPKTVAEARKVMKEHFAKQDLEKPFTRPKD